MNKNKLFLHRKSKLRFLITVITITLIMGIFSANRTNIAFTEEKQYIPEDLDYYEVIKKIKQDEGIMVLEARPRKFTGRTSYEPFILPQNLEPVQYKILAYRHVKKAASLSESYAKRELARRALMCYKKYLEFYPSDLNALIGAGNLAGYLKKEEEAKNILMQAYATYPQNPDVHRALGDYSFRFSNYNNAIEYYNLSLASGNLKDYATNLSTAICYEKLGNIKMAFIYFKIAQKINPDSNIANKKIEMYEKAMRDGYRSDPRLYDEAAKVNENDDAELEDMIFDSHFIK